MPRETSAAALGRLFRSGTLSPRPEERCGPGFAYAGEILELKSWLK